MNRLFSITPTNNGANYLQQTLGEKAVSGQKTTVNYDGLTDRQLSVIFKVEKAKIKHMRSSNFLELIDDIRSDQGQFIVSNDIESLKADIDTPAFKSNSAMVNTRSGRVGKGISDSDTSGFYTMGSFDMGSTNGLGKVEVTSVGSNISPDSVSKYNNSLAFSYALGRAMYDKGLADQKVDFIPGSNNAPSFLVTHSNKVVSGAVKNDLGFNQRKSARSNDAIKFDLNDLMVMKSGKSPALIHDDNIRLSYNLLKSSSSATKESFFTQIILSQLIGSKPLSGDQVTFSTSVQQDKIHVKLNPLSGTESALVCDESHKNTKLLDIEGRSLRSIQMKDVMTGALAGIYDAEPNLMNKAFINACEVRDMAFRHVADVLEPAGAVFKGFSSSLTDHFDKPQSSNTTEYAWSSDRASDPFSFDDLNRV